ncbi:hypothetical protein NDU88_002042 [Pleurodeles waltl]|uniref:Uncharacterized protein n=1 Tax=Pleurodeles waltl TaxID=8319 RepID=A0AAV7Q8R6_PLEWA|nr:hypothetical protein NDU88_002042 [Pleurodeles waltl]
MRPGAPRQVSPRPSGAAPAADNRHVEAFQPPALWDTAGRSRQARRGFYSPCAHLQNKRRREGGRTAYARIFEAAGVGALPLIYKTDSFANAQEVHAHNRHKENFSFTRQRRARGEHQEARPQGS